ncbi:MAG TPA: pilus assembly protein TadG-related protein [Stenomitos sp.]
MASRKEHQKGATLVTTALFATGLVVIAGLVADTGAMMYHRTRMQVAADAAALAGTKGLLNGRDYGIAQAQEMAGKNGYELKRSNIGIAPCNLRMLVVLETPNESLVGRVLKAVKGEDPDNANPLTVGARAQADLYVVGTNYGVRPFGVPEADFKPGAEYVLKQGPGGSIRGNFQALGLDGTGADVYRTSILNGANRTVHVGDMVPTEPGNMNGPTVSAVNQLLGNDSTSYQDASKGNKTPRVMTLPLMGDSFFAVNGRSNVTIAGFARFYVTYTTSRGEVYGRFIERVSEPEIKGTTNQYSVRLSDEGDPEPTLPTTRI